MHHARVPYAMALLTVAGLAAECIAGLLLESGEPEPRKPPLAVPLLTDQSAYVGLGDGAGTVVALGDFTRDRHVDLLVVPDARRMRAVFVREWRQNRFEFQGTSANAWNATGSSYRLGFSLDQVYSLSSSAAIASAVTLDADVDGCLDVLLSVRETNGVFEGLLLLGNGMGGFRIGAHLPGLTPGMLVMDGNDDLLPDIFFISATSPGERVFLINNSGGKFSKQVWDPHDDPIRRRYSPDEAVSNSHRATVMQNSNAWVDINGDCQPDLVVTTECGMEVWLSTAAGGGEFANGQHGVDHAASPFLRSAIKSRSAISPIWDRSVAANRDMYILLGEEVWSHRNGDGRAVYADFNGDGTIDIAVPNSRKSQILLSLNVQKLRRPGSLCIVDPDWHFHSTVALSDVKVAETVLGPTRVQATIRTGDFNYDGYEDILFINANTGTVELYEARPTSLSWSRGGSVKMLSRLSSRFLFTLLGYHRRNHDNAHGLQFVRVSGHAVLGMMEDPVAATFLDVGQSGRQDVLVSQSHGTRLVWNSFATIEDSSFFKATGVVNAFSHREEHHKGSSPLRPPLKHTSYPLHGSTFKISYGGRHGREQHVCSQCPQSGFLTLQACSCFFGITRIANYIEELAMGGGGEIRAWSGLMPNVLAIVSPVGARSRRWKVTYVSKGRDGQMRRVSIVLGTTLVLLALIIAYLHILEEKAEEGSWNWRTRDSKHMHTFL